MLVVIGFTVGISATYVKLIPMRFNVVCVTVVASGLICNEIGNKKKVK